MKTKPASMSEADLCQAAIPWLESRGWTLYFEVSFKGHSGRADIVAVKDHLVWLIEAKKAANLDVISQAYEWVDDAHMVSILTPTMKFRGQWAKKSALPVILAHLGIGHLKINRDMELIEALVPPLREGLAAASMLRQLRPEHQTFAAPGTAGTFWTVFKETCGKVAQIVADSPGITVKDLVDKHGKFHYAKESSAKTSLANRAARGFIKGVRVELAKSPSAMRLFPG